MITKLDQRHISIVKFENGMWFAVRPMQQSDYSGIHMEPVPLNCADKRVMYEGEWHAADLLIAPLQPEDRERFTMTEARFEEINKGIVDQTQKLAAESKGRVMNQQPRLAVKARFYAEFIERELLAAGSVTHLSIFRPSQQTLEALNKLTTGQYIEYLELGQGTHGEKVERYYLLYEVVLCLADSARDDVFYLLLKNVDVKPVEKA